MDTFKFYREIGLLTVAMIWVSVPRWGMLDYSNEQRINMIILGLLPANNGGHCEGEITFQMLLVINRSSSVENVVV